MYSEGFDVAVHTKFGDRFAMPLVLCLAQRVLAAVRAMSNVDPPSLQARPPCEKQGKLGYLCSQYCRLRHYRFTGSCIVLMKQARGNLILVKRISWA